MYMHTARALDAALRLFFLNFFLFAEIFFSNFHTARALDAARRL